MRLFALVAAFALVIVGAQLLVPVVAAVVVGEGSASAAQSQSPYTVTPGAALADDTRFAVLVLPLNGLIPVVVHVPGSSHTDADADADTETDGGVSNRMIKGWRMSRPSPHNGAPLHFTHRVLDAEQRHVVTEPDPRRPPKARGLCTGLYVGGEYVLITDGAEPCSAPKWIVFPRAAADAHDTSADLTGVDPVADAECARHGGCLHGSLAPDEVYELVTAVPLLHNPHELLQGYDSLPFMTLYRMRAAAPLLPPFVDTFASWRGDQYLGAEPGAYGQRAPQQHERERMYDDIARASTSTPFRSEIPAHIKALALERAGAVWPWRADEQYRECARRFSASDIDPSIDPAAAAGARANRRRALRSRSRQSRRRNFQQANKMVPWQQLHQTPNYLSHSHDTQPLYPIVYQCGPSAAVPGVPHGVPALLDESDWRRSRLSRRAGAGGVKDAAHARCTHLHAARKLFQSAPHGTVRERVIRVDFGRDDVRWATSPALDALRVDDVVRRRWTVMPPGTIRDVDAPPRYPRQHADEHLSWWYVAYKDARNRDTDYAGGPLLQERCVAAVAPAHSHSSEYRYVYDSNDGLMQAQPNWKCTYSVFAIATFAVKGPPTPLVYWGVHRWWQLSLPFAITRLVAVDGYDIDVDTYSCGITSAPCPASGYLLSFGNCAANLHPDNDAHYRIANSYPTAAGAWQCVAAIDASYDFDRGQETSITAYANCVNPLVIRADAWRSPFAADQLPALTAAMHAQYPSFDHTTGRTTLPDPDTRSDGRALADHMWRRAELVGRLRSQMEVYVLIVTSSTIGSYPDDQHSPTNDTCEYPQVGLWAGGFTSLLMVGADADIYFQRWSGSDLQQESGTGGPNATVIAWMGLDSPTRNRQVLNNVFGCGQLYAYNGTVVPGPVWTTVPKKATPDGAVHETCGTTSTLIGGTCTATAQPLPPMLLARGQIDEYQNDFDPPLHVSNLLSCTFEPDRTEGSYVGGVSVKLQCLSN